MLTHTYWTLLHAINLKNSMPVYGLPIRQTRTFPFFLLSTRQNLFFKSTYSITFKSVLPELTSTVCDNALSFTPGLPRQAWYTNYNDMQLHIHWRISHPDYLLFHWVLRFKKKRLQLRKRKKICFSISFWGHAILTLALQSKSDLSKLTKGKWTTFQFPFNRQQMETAFYCSLRKINFKYHH